MKPVFVLRPHEDWIVDRFVKEWSEDNADITTNDLITSKVIWLYADWCWEHVPLALLRERRVLTTIHHVVPDKFTAANAVEFARRDQITAAYHVPNEHTAQFVRERTSKPVHVIPYWANDKIWRKTGSKAAFRQRHGIPAGAFVVGSFQRDTEGRDLISPKLEKGPDLLADFLQVLAVHRDNLHVLLAGWRRQYIISRLQAARIQHTYIERPSQPMLNELYQCVDLYPVSARWEGGPQSLIECGLLGVECISRDVGMAKQVLPLESINDDLAWATPHVPVVEHLRLPAGYTPFRELLQSL